MPMVLPNVRMGELRRELSASGQGGGQAHHSVHIGIHRGEGGEEGGAIIANPASPSTGRRLRQGGSP